MAATSGNASVLLAKWIVFVMICKKVALIGSNGMLAHMLRKVTPLGVELTLFDLPEFDITDRGQVLSQLSALNPDFVINCAAMTNVDGCESQPEQSFLVNGTAPGYLAEVTRQLGAILVHISTDFVFSGDKTTPYVELDKTEPLSVYGQSKLAGEQAILHSRLDKYYIVRTSWLYGPAGSNFVETVIRLAVEREELGIVSDQIGTPTSTADLVAAIWTLLGESQEQNRPAPFGIYHYSNDGICSWYEFACAIVKHMRQAEIPLKLKELKPITTAEYPLPANRPAYSVMFKGKIISATDMQIPHWQESLKQYMISRLKG